jgi:methionyl-tRNA formyltransferase
MEDPVYTLPFIKSILDNRETDIIGVATVKGNRLTIKKNRSKLAYLFSLLLIMGVFHFCKNSIVSISYKFRKYISSKLKFIKDPSILKYAQEKNIETFKINNPNSKVFIKRLRSLKPDLIINQSQSILKKDILGLPKLGIINRHNALLPKNRGRLTPFWVLKKGEAETGVSIHFVTEEIDAGDIIVQKRFPVLKKDNFNSLVKKNYQLAESAILEALNKLESGDKNYIKNEDEFSTYNSTPTLKDAFSFRCKRFFKLFK